MVSFKMNRKNKVKQTSLCTGIGLSQAFYPGRKCYSKEKSVFNHAPSIVYNK